MYFHIRTGPAREAALASKTRGILSGSKQRKHYRRRMLPSNHVLSFGMKRNSHDGRTVAKANPKRTELLHRREDPLAVRTDLTAEATKDISDEMNAILAEEICQQLKTKYFKDRKKDNHFRNYHLLLDEHAEQLFAMTD